MVSQKVTVKNKSGLHLRPATELTKLCSALTSRIALVNGDKRIDPKSVLLLMSAGIKCGTTIEVICEGEAEKSDLVQIIKTIEGGFGEEMIEN